MSNDEATAIAKLLGEDGKSVVGWVYRWESSLLSVYWTEKRRPARFVNPPLRQETLLEAKDVGSADVVEFLETLDSLS